MVLKENSTDENNVPLLGENEKGEIPLLTEGERGSILYSSRRHLEWKSLKKKAVKLCFYVNLCVLFFDLVFLAGNFARDISTYSQRPYHALLDDEYLKVLSDSNLAGNWSYMFTKEPHLAGMNRGLAEWQASKYKEFGLENVEIEEFNVYLNYPLDKALKLVSADSGSLLYQPTLTEDEIAEDPSTVGNDLVPAFHGYSANGNTTAEYIYANYGTKEDFELLKDNSVDVAGKVVIVRYGKLFRGLKVKFAQEAGASGVLIYSEPSDDGYISIDNGYKPYPEGPARNPSSLQRGSVQYLSQIPGDPTTPGWPSKGGKSKVDRVDPHHSIPKIPSLPISYEEVQPILAQLNGHGVRFGQEKGWEGTLENVTYHVGPNPEVQLNLYNSQHYNITPIHNVYGEIPGTLYNEVVLLGNHRDAWIKGGAGDPNSGSAVTLEVIRALNVLKDKFGWKPLRTIRFASWDGEEYGLLGSTEFGELHRRGLQRKVVAYLNLDDAVAGSQLSMEASPLLYRALNQAAAKVDYPDAATKKGGLKSDDKISLRDHFYLHSDKIGILGSGSDFTVFLEHLGIPSLNVVFEPGPEDPVYHYHSNYDSFHWMEKYGDPGFVFHNTMAQFFGLLTLNLAETKYLNFGLVENALEISEYFNESVKRVPGDWWGQRVSLKYDDVFRAEDNRATKEELELRRIIKMADVPRLKQNKKAWTKDHMHDESLEELVHKTQLALARFVDASVEFEKHLAGVALELREYETNYASCNPWALYKRLRLSRKYVAANQRIQYLERQFLHYGGLRDRSWFRHIVFAVDRNNGYSAISLPGINEALEDSLPGELAKWVALLDAAVQRATHSLA